MLQIYEVIFQPLIGKDKQRMYVYVLEDIFVKINLHLTLVYITVGPNMPWNAVLMKLIKFWTRSRGVPVRKTIKLLSVLPGEADISVIQPK